MTDDAVIVGTPTSDVEALCLYCAFPIKNHDRTWFDSGEQTMKCRVHAVVKQTERKVVTVENVRV